MGKVCFICNKLNNLIIIIMEALDNFHWRSDPRNQSEDYETDSRTNNPLLWELYDSLVDDARKKGIDVNWVSDDLNTVVIGNYEVSQGVFGSHDFKCLDIVPHSSENMGKFRLFFDEVDEAMSFFNAHFNVLEKTAVAV